MFKWCNKTINFFVQIQIWSRVARLGQIWNPPKPLNPIWPDLDIYSEDVLIDSSYVNMPMLPRRNYRKGSLDI